MYFVCQVERGTAVMTVHVVINADYPTASSLVVLAIKWRSVIKTAVNDEAIRVNKNIQQSCTGDD